METKQEFIDGLRRALTGRISQEEIEEHIRYYEDYITAETRIKGSEQEVLNALGNPKLIAMSICAATNPMVEEALKQLEKLKYTEAHYTKMLNPQDEITFRKLNINITCEPEFMSQKLYNQ